MRVIVRCGRAGEGGARRAEEYFVAGSDGERMPAGGWIYVGSRLDASGFAAQRDGSIVALLNDPDALVSKDLPAARVAEEWLMDEALAPGEGAEVSVTFELGTKVGSR